MRTLLLVIFVTFASTSLAVEESPRPPRETFADLAAGGDEAKQASSEFRELVRRSDYPGDQEQLDELLEFCRDHVSRFLDGEIPSPGYRLLPSHVSLALEQLQRFPSREAAPVARRILDATDAKDGRQTTSAARGDALSILATVGDPAVRRPLEDMVTRGPEGIEACRMLVDLGDPRSIPFLESVEADSSLADTLIARARLRAKDPEVVNEGWLEEQSARIRVAARRAARDLRLAQRGIVVPFDLADHHVDRLLDQGFSVLPETANDLYTLIRPEYPFITSDVVWRTFMILMRETWNDLEPLVIEPETFGWLVALLDATVERSTTFEDEALRNLALRNAARLAVAVRLLDDTVPLPLAVSELELIDDEVGRIEAAEGLHDSKLLGYVEDYRYYLPNGRHAGSPELGRWFRAVSWLGRATWRFASDPGIRETLSLADVVRSSPDLLPQWQRIEALMVAWLGDSDDITIAQVLATVDDPRRALVDERAFTEASRALRALPLPRINSLPDATSMENGQGMRVFGSRYTVVAETIQTMIDNQIWPLSSADIFTGLKPQFDQPDAAGKPLMEAGMACLAGLHHLDPRCPPFMKTDAWSHKQLNTSLAGWTELQHALAPYLKTAEDIKGGSSLRDLFHGYVEPSLVFYERLHALVLRTIADLESADYFERVAAEIPTMTRAEWVEQHMEPDTGPPAKPIGHRIRIEKEYRRSRMRADRTRWSDFELLLRELLDLSKRELAGQPQTASDFIFMRNLNRRLQHLSMNDSNSTMATQPLGLATEIAMHRTKYEAMLLAVGRPLAAIVAVPTPTGRVVVCKGPVYAFHELVTSVDERPTDEQWREADNFPSIGSRVPWIFNHPDLDWRRDISEEELRDLTLTGELQGSVSMHVHGVAHWRRYYDELAGVRVPPELADVLCEIAGNIDVRQGDRMYLLQSAASMTGDSFTLEHWNRLLDIAEYDLEDGRTSKRRSRRDMIIYWSFISLQDHPEGADTLARARALLAQLPDSVREKMVELIAASDT